jgi:pSer/pThr/pTyr-binding forkhead associated (FHA) protein
VKIVVEKGPQEGTAFRLHDGMNTLGRDSTHRIRLSDPRVSRNHCKIRKVGQSLFITDLGTRNGTLVNGKSVRSVELKVGDRIEAGNTVLRVVDEEYQVTRRSEEPSPASLFHHLSMAVRGRRRSATSNATDEELQRLVKKSRRPVRKKRGDAISDEKRQITLER